MRSPNNLLRCGLQDPGEGVTERSTRSPEAIRGGTTQAGGSR